MLMSGTKNNMGKSIKNIKKLNITWKHLLLDILRNSPTHTQNNIGMSFIGLKNI